MEDSFILPRFREPELGESSIGVVMESLVPSYRETMSPTPIPTYQGRSVVSRVGTSGDTGLLEKDWGGYWKGLCLVEGLGI
jgi:hypothetical protein